MRDILLDVQDLTHQFRLSRTAVVRAVDGISFRLCRGEILGLVGESGSGKSTVAKCVMNVYRPTAGKILYRGIDVCDPRQFRENRALLQRTRQVIFQDSTSSLNQRMRVADIIAEPMEIHRVRPPRGSFRAEAAYQLRYVGLDESCLDKYPPELSGGMRQRVAIGRARALEPGVLGAEEPGGAQGACIQAPFIKLLAHCNREHNCSILFIAHDLAVVRYLCHRVGVMYRGKLVELAPTEELFAHPLHPYTQALLSAIPIPDPRLERARVLQEFDSSQLRRDGTMVEAAPGHLVLKGGAP